jgi:hypothetical protein
MKLPRFVFVAILVSSLLIAPNGALFAQSPAQAAPAAANAVQTPVAPSLQALLVPPMPAAPNRLSMPAFTPPQASNSKKIGVALGLAMTGTGAVLLAMKEDPHQTTCVPYGACPRPGIVKISGATMIGIGIPLTILKLKR